MVWKEEKALHSSGSCSAAAHRQFYNYSSSQHSPADDAAADKPDNSDKLAAHIAQNIIGSDTVFSSPYGPRKVVYCDYTASGRSVQFLEDFISQEVLPHYGSTHTTATNTALQTTMFRHEARDVLRSAVRASESDRVLLTGSGATGAVVRLLHGLHLTAAPVVMSGPFLHHSAQLPWREAGAKVISIREAADGSVDLKHLEEMLLQENMRLSSSSGSTSRSCPCIIGCFSAASNITGLLTDTVAVTVLLHRHNALAFWDYATAAPYVSLDMNPVVIGDTHGLAHKDAMFFSMHKFVGGPQTPGVLVAKRALFRHPVPALPGGGSIFFVSRDRHRFLQEEEQREEGGTPAIVGDIRAGLVMGLKQALTESWIERKNEDRARQLAEFVARVPNLVSLGPAFGQDSPRRLPILSFMVRYQPTTTTSCSSGVGGLFLHYNFVTALLNDLFGVQARGGCACAGPYALDLLGMSERLADDYHEALVEPHGLNRHELRRRQEHSDSEVLRPGFVRLNLPFTADQEQVEFVLSCVELVCRSGWRLLPQYTFSPDTGEWKHRKQQSLLKDRQWLGNISYSDGRFRLRQQQTKAAAPDYAACLAQAGSLMEQADKTARQYPDTSADQLILDEKIRHLRWFILPSEARTALLQQHNGGNHVTNGAIMHQQQQKVGNHHSNGATESFTMDDHTCDGHTRSDEVCCDDAQEMAHGSSEAGGRLSTEESWCHAAPFSPALYPLSERVLAGRADHVWQQEPRLHYWPTMVVDGRTGGGNDVGVGQGWTAGVDRKLGDDEGRGDERGRQYRVTNLPKTDVTVGDCGREEREGVEQGRSTEGMGDTLIEPLNNLLLEDRVNSTCPVTDESEYTSSKNNSGAGDYSDDTSVQRTNEKNTLTNTEKLDINTSPVSEINLIIIPNNTTSNSLKSPSNKSSSKKKENNRKFFSNGLTKSLTPRAKEDLKEKKDVACTELTCFLPRPQSDLKLDTRLKAKWHLPPKNLFAPMLEAIHKFSMIRDGDRVLVCLSGGKDSLSLLHLLHQYQYLASASGVHYTLGAVTVDPESAAYDPRPLIPYLNSLGVEYLYEQQGILQQALALPDLNSICSFCSRMKRGRIYAAARRRGYNVLAFGQHLDDLAESFLMSVFHNGRLRTMKAAYAVQEEDLRVIRPLVFVREKHLRHFAESRKLPVIPENCPACFEVPKERHRSKQLLAQQEVLFPQVYSSLRTALLPLMAISATGTENRVLGKQGALEGAFTRLMLVQGGAAAAGGAAVVDNAAGGGVVFLPNRDENGGKL